MTTRRAVLFLAIFAFTATVAFAQATTGQKPFEPQVGQAGKDVVWVPTPQALVDKMLDMAKVTPKDFVIDLGSGDGRNVIAAAKILHTLTNSAEVVCSEVAVTRAYSASASVISCCRASRPSLSPGAGVVRRR